MKNKTTAILLAIFLGGFGIHKFYLGQKKQGVLMLVFFWTIIPALIALVNFFQLLFMKDEEFNKKYNKEQSIDGQSKKMEEMEKRLQELEGSQKK